MADVRALAKKFLDQVKDTDISSNNPATAGLFKDLTGWTQEKLQTQWATEDIPKKARRDAGIKDMSGLATTTTCNAFVGYLGGSIGSPISLGQFDIEQKLKKAGLGDAWIPASSGQKPGMGDVFRPWKFHMGVSYDFSGNTWNTVESGQGGPGEDYTKGFDIIRRKHTDWDPTKLQGWVDIEILMKLATKAPKWMQGWWRFELNGTKQFVWIPERGNAQMFDAAPQSVKLAPGGEGKKGELTLDPDSEGATIVWSASVTDTVRHLKGVDYMLGQRGAAQIQAYKLKA